MVPRTMGSKTPRLARPIPAPYNVLARQRASFTSGVGMTQSSQDRIAKRLDELGGALALVWHSRDRAALANAEARCGVPVARRLRVMARRLDRRKFPYTDTIGKCNTHSSALAFAMNVSAMRFLSSRAFSTGIDRVE